MHRPAVLALLCVLWPTFLATAAEKPTAEQLEFFEQKIRPVLVKHCYECHSRKSKPPKGGLLLDTRESLLRGGDSGAALQPGKVDESLLIGALRYDTLEMPPKGKLPARVIADFERWVKMGSPDPRDGSTPIHQSTIDYAKGANFWSFQQPRLVAPRKVRDERWAHSDLDRYVLAKLEQDGLRPAPPADRTALIRRAYFDLIGLPPTPQEVRAFLDDPSPDAFKKVIDHLLASRHYGERWGRHWLDIARFGEDQAHTFKARNYPQGYRYRDWVIKALNDDMPYDRFLRYQIAGDLIDDPNPHDRVAALGLFALGPVYYQDNGEKAKALADEWDDRVDTLMRGVLGLTAACARCHDHKYDPISMTDYYALAGVFASSQYQERPIVAREVVQARRDGEAAHKQQQLKIARFLATKSRDVRAGLVDRIPRYIQVAAQVARAKTKDKKLVEKTAQREKLSAALLKRWVHKLEQDDDPEGGPRPHWKTLRELVRAKDAKNAEAVAAAAEALRKKVAELAPSRAEVFQKFGDNLAFVKPKDRAKVPPGVVPLGNLFDDRAGASLDAAVASDRFKAAASADSLGVERTRGGLGDTVEIAPGVRLDLRKLGADGAKHGTIANDGWDARGGISTRGKRNRDNLGRREQGVGMHANAMITFDLDEIRRAGLLPQDQSFMFHVDRAGMNDDVFGSDAPRAHLAVIVSKPHRQKDVYDAILSGHVNGKAVSVDENDKTYYFSGQVPDPLRADGKFVAFKVPLPADAKYLTLITAAAAGKDEDNTINSDHTVFSGARLKWQVAADAVVADKKNEQAKGGANPQQRADAILLSEFFYDEGLLAIPAPECEPYLDDQAKVELKRRREKLAELKKAYEKIETPSAHALGDGKGVDLKIYLQGDPTKQGQTARRSMPAIFTAGQRKAFQSKGSGRRELADAIASPSNSLTARVIVNRLWRGHFGHGLVRTPSNFGSLGERPTHPELLDYLAIQLIKNGWSLKSIHRQIMLSATYRMSSRFDEKAYSVDPDNRSLWRMNRRRLEVEPWRDAMLSVAGRLNDAMGGASFDLTSADATRRTVYGRVSRHRLNELLRLFDFPDPNITAARRSVTTVPLQQLFVINSDFMVRQARELTARLQRERKDDDARVRRAYWLLFSRAPTEAEARIGQEFLALAADLKQPNDQLSPWEQYAMALLGSNEFAFVD